MRIRTGETETRFSLPQGTEFYLRQESAPEGFIFDAQTLIPVTDSEIVVRNQAYGRVTISVRDTLGEGIEGVSLTATDGAGNQTELVTDENGQAVLLCDHAGAYAIAESGLPEGVLPAENDSVQVQAAPGSAAEVAFEHPAPGLVQAAATLVSVNALGEQEEKPLAGLALCVAGQTATTDADGAASLNLPEGTYDAQLVYTGEGSVVLPFTQGQIIVRSGETTRVEVSASSAEGRIAVQAESGHAVSGGAVRFISDATGESYGPYAMDADGFAVSDALPGRSLSP